MVYQIYEEYKWNFLVAQERFMEMLTEKERIFTKTQPNAIRYDKEKIQTSPDGNILEEYVIEMERKRINERLAELRLIMSDREGLLRLKEYELKTSKDIDDQIYCLKYLENKKVEKIAKFLGYSESQIYRRLEKIDAFAKRCEKMRNKS